MPKKATAIFLIMALLAGTLPAAARANPGASPQQAAQDLHRLGLFMGMGTNPDGSPMFALERQPTRAEAIAMFVRLVGGAEEAHSRQWSMPFTDVPSWARPYVGYAWHNGLTTGVSQAQFGSHQPVTAAQYLTFVLRALGYESDVDFRWSTAWTLTDAKGITNGRYNAATNSSFTRGDLAAVSFAALGGEFAGGGATLADALVAGGVFTEAQAQAAGLRAGAGVAAQPAPPAQNQPTPAPGQPTPPPQAGQPAQPTPTPQAGQPTPTPATAQATRVTIASGTRTVSAGDTLELEAAVQPQNAEQTVAWSTSDPSVATVSAAGVVTGVSPGTATITATAAGGATATANINIAWRIPASTITLPNRRLTEAERDEWIREYDARGGAYEFELEVIRLTNIERANHGLQPVTLDRNLMLAARFYAQTMGNLDTPLGHHEGPYGGSGETARVFGAGGSWRNGIAGGVRTPASHVERWMNSPGHRANILQQNVRHIGVGFHEGGRWGYFGYMVLTVEPTGGVQVMPTGVTLSQPSPALSVGITQTVAATFQPANANVRTLTWTTSDAAVATVHGGNVRGIAPGAATITATTANGLTAAVTVTVTAVLPTGVTISPATFNLNLGQSRTVTASVQPHNAGNRTVAWASSDPAVATVAANGLVTGISIGTATITATTHNGLAATATVTVGGIQPTGVAISPAVLNLNVGQIQTLTGTVQPHNAANRTLTWTSSDPAVATVAANGRVTGVAAGTATITAAAHNGLTATATVTVGGALPTGVTVAPATLTLYAGQSQPLAATVQPANAANRTVAWTSSNPAVATVAADGTVTGVAAGTATITAATHNGLTAAASVTVNAGVVPPTGVSVAPRYIELQVGAAAVLVATVSPANATDRSVTWTSSAPSVASVSQDGTVTAHAPGSALIMAGTSCGQFTDAVSVTVAAPPAPQPDPEPEPPTEETDTE